MHTQTAPGEPSDRVGDVKEDGGGGGEERKGHQVGGGPVGDTGKQGTRSGK